MFIIFCKTREKKSNAFPNPSPSPNPNPNPQSLDGLVWWTGLKTIIMLMKIHL